MKCMASGTSMTVTSSGSWTGQRIPPAAAPQGHDSGGGGHGHGGRHCHARRHAGYRRSRQSRTDRKSTRLNSSHLGNSYAVFCLKKEPLELFNLKLETLGKLHLGTDHNPTST